MDWKVLGRKIRRARRSRDLTQQQLAEMVEVHYITISRIENGNLPGVTLALTVKIAEALELSIDELVGEFEPAALALV